MRQLEGFRQEFEVFRRRLAAEWETERDSDPQSTEDAKLLFEAALAEIHDFMSRIKTDESGKLKELFRDMALQIKELSTHQTYLDGGKSFGEFWQLGDQCLAILEQISEALADPTMDSAHGESALFREEELTILELLAKRLDDSFEAQTIASMTGIPEQRAQYFLDRLSERGYIDHSLVIGQPIEYHLSKQGRAALFDRGLL